MVAWKDFDFMLEIGWCAAILQDPTPGHTDEGWDPVDQKDCICAPWDDRLHSGAQVLTGLSVSAENRWKHSVYIYVYCWIPALAMEACQTFHTDPAAVYQILTHWLFTFVVRLKGRIGACVAVLHQQWHRSRFPGGLCFCCCTPLSIALLILHVWLALCPCDFRGWSLRRTLARLRTGRISHPRIHRLGAQFHFEVFTIFYIFSLGEIFCNGGRWERQWGMEQGAHMGWRSKELAVISTWDGMVVGILGCQLHYKV